MRGLKIELIYYSASFFFGTQFYFFEGPPHSLLFFLGRKNFKNFNFNCKQYGIYRSGHKGNLFCNLLFLVNCVSHFLSFLDG